MAKKTKSKKEEMVPVFTPALVSLLLKKEKEKGAPLTEAEVLEIRDNSTMIMMKSSAVRSMSDSRGYEDIDPERAWEQWSKIRKQFYK
jgi:hypothetical protein